MAEVLNDFDYDKQCENCRTDICSASVDGTEYTHCIKEYFMKEDKQYGYEEKSRKRRWNL